MTDIPSNERLAEQFVKDGGVTTFLGIVAVQLFAKWLDERSAAETTDSYGCTGCRSTPCICEQLGAVKHSFDENGSDV